MKKLVYQVSGMLLLVGLSASPGLAGTLFKAAMLCNNGGSGSASIKTNGDVKIKVKGLEANTAYTCQAVCQCSGSLPAEHIVDQTGGSCTTDANGQLNVTFAGAAADFLCKCPSVEIFDGQDCISGFDLS